MKKRYLFLLTIALMFTSCGTSSENSSNNNESDNSSEVIISSSSESLEESSIEVDTTNDSYKGDYYSSINANLTGDSLVKALGGLLESTHRVVTYQNLRGAYKDTDLIPGTNKIWDVYTTYQHEHVYSLNSSYPSEGSGYNREHVIPKSWFNDTSSPMYSDIYHVIPADGWVNEERGNNPYAEVGNASYTTTNGSKLGTSSVSGISGTVFEPCDEYKGDFARIFFYMATRYYSKVGSWSGGVFKSSYPYINNEYFELYKKWALEDPVSEKEIQRNVGGEKNQGNRNPYVDCPSLFYKAYCM